MTRALLALCCSLITCGLSTPCAAEPEADWAPAATQDGVHYQRVEELRSFYKLNTGIQPLRKGALAAMSLGDVRLELGPGKREMSIGGLRMELAYPLMQDSAGQLLISREDWVSWVDPILRPTYIAGRAPVRNIVLDPGHGGHDGGVSVAAGSEADITLQIARRLRVELEKLGYQVQLTRSGDYFLSDQQRVDLANAASDAIFISLHLNTGRSDFHGSRVYTLAPAAPGAQPLPGHTRSGSHAALAYALQSALVRCAGAADAGCHHAHFSLLSSVSCPAVWVELGYTTHEQEGAALSSPAYQDTLAAALARGICTYIKVADPATSIPIQEPPPKITVKSPPPTPKKTATTPPAKKPAQSTAKKPTKPTPAAESSRRRTRNTRTRSR